MATSLIFAFKSVVFLIRSDTTGIKSFLIIEGYRYLKKVGSAFFRSSKIAIKFLRTGSLLPSSMNSRKIL